MDRGVTQAEIQLVQRETTITNFPYFTEISYLAFLS